MSTVHDLAFEYLIHGYDKNDTPRPVALVRARNLLLCMGNDALLELISDMVEQRLEAFKQELQA